MDGFYGLLAFAIGALSLTLAFAVKPSQSVPNFDNAIRQAQALDDDAAKAMCEVHVNELLTDSAGVPGSMVLDPRTGRQAVLVAGP